MKTVAVVPVRMGSSRLPGKVMRKINGKPLLGHTLDRIGLSKTVDEIVVATSIHPENDLINTYCNNREISCFRGDEDDMLGRLVGALKQKQADIGVLIFGDCPLVDPIIIDELVKYFQSHQNDFDFVSNDLKTTYAPGMEVEVFTVSALEDAAEKCDDQSVREHGSLYLRQNPDQYKIKNIEAPDDFAYPNIELEVDTIEDVEVMESIFNHFGNRVDFGFQDILSFLNDNPQIMQINKDIHRRWKAFRSLDSINN